MRDEILTYLGTQSFSSYIVSTELPFDSNGTELYIKNPKRIYVDNAQLAVEPFIGVMSAMNIDQETTTVNIYFANDAKTLPSDYSTVVTSCRNAKNQTYTVSFFNTYSDTKTEYKNDLLVTNVELRFIRIITS